MAGKKQTKGDCVFCQQSFTKGGLTKHLQTCAKRKELMYAADAKAGKEQVLYHLAIQDKYAKDFWLHVEMNGTAQLSDLDSYLRSIWLECCGHLSAFEIKGEEAVSMSRRADQVFELDMELEHIYDFGESSETLIKVVGKRQGKALSKHPLKLMARNELPEIYCIECGQPASWLCQECIIEDNESGLLCDKHVKKHPHDNYGEPIELVNSPRLGMCGYTGPAEAPY